MGYADTEAFSRRLLFETECKNIYDFGEWYDTDIRTPDFQSHFHNDENAPSRKEKRRKGNEIRDLRKGRQILSIEE